MVVREGRLIEVYMSFFFILRGKKFIKIILLIVIGELYKIL